MKNINRILFTTILATIFVLSSCKKYEDGPSMSLLTKTQRLTGTWEVKEFTINGMDLMDQYDSYEMEFEKDGDVEFISQEDGSNPINIEKGEWEFSSNKEEIEIDWDDSSMDQEIEITRLTNKEFEGEMKSYSFDQFGNTTTVTIKFEAEKD